MSSSAPVATILAMENKGGTTRRNIEQEVHYKHTDACNSSRWTTREAYQFMYTRPWKKVDDFYSEVVAGRSDLPKLFRVETCQIPDANDIIEAPTEPHFVSSRKHDRSGRWARLTFKIVLSYHGASFDGWQKQPGLNTVQGIVEQSLGKFVDDKKAGVLKDKGLPIEGCVVVAGRTDKGVTGFRQVCSFYTWRTDVKAQEIEDAINNSAPGKLRVISVAKVSREFHPNFSAKWRRYLYIFPFNDWEDGVQSSQDEGNVKSDCSNEHEGDNRNSFGKYYGGRSSELDSVLDNEKDIVGIENKPTRFKVVKVNQLLRQLEGKLLSYKMFARDTKPSRNTGPPTECFLCHARAAEATLSSDEKDGKRTKLMCVELVANRFLRKMVRVLVATSIREAAAGAEDDALIQLMDATCRRATAPPAPPNGLCLVDVGYNDFDPQSCFIH